MFTLFGKSKKQKEKEAAEAAAAQKLATNRQGKIKRTIYSGPRDEFATNVWKTPEEWAEINAERNADFAKRNAENKARQNAAKRKKEDEDIAYCVKVVELAKEQGRLPAQGGRRTKKYRKNKNKNTRRKH